ncbi:hypothetical protein EZV62_017025 [Acer yangbiense]|uniref:Uncharacterized protein n=1 Tax=Acer yangbiense TaxID=1000413 RepID=A0A5C7HSF1_9ROSI|nr:hypothetical protein EZV62_017025 [Acer yangbiense]
MELPVMKKSYQTREEKFKRRVKRYVGIWCCLDNHTPESRTHITTCTGTENLIGNLSHLKLQRMITHHEVLLVTSSYRSFAVMWQVVSAFQWLYDDFSVYQHISGKVAELLVVPIGKKLCYPFKYKSNMEELKQQVEKLRNAKESVQHSIDEAKRQGDDIEKDVEKWLSSVDEFAEKIVKPIIDEEDKAKNLCSTGFSPNLMTRYSLAKKAAKTAKDGVNLLREGKFEKVSHCPAIGRTKSFYTRGHEDFGSRMLKNFLVEILSDVEARNLFWKIVNHSEEKPDFNAIAVEIVKKCAGLPVAITAVANASKNGDLSDWKNSLQWLRKSNPKAIKGMEASVYSTIELSYNKLGHEEQSLFLLCSLENAGTNIHTLDLFKYSMGLGLFKDVDTMEEARNRMHTLISNLKASCLLLDGKANDFVKVHDIIHAVAISIASSKDNLMFNIQNATRMKEMLEEKQPKDSIGISLPWLEIDELPETLEFPKLELFLLLSRDDSSKIPDAFFEGVKGLKVLNLTALELLALPSSLGMLMNLRTLCLDDCLLGDIAIIGKLKKLEILSFRQADIELLSREIGQLTRLRVLDLSNCSTLKVITPNVISGLTRLEELYMGNSFIHWDVEGQSNASLAELKKLSNLTTLEIHVLDAQIMPGDLFFGKLERYRIFIGDVWKWSGKYETSKTLKLKLNSSFYLNDGVKFLVNKAEDLHLDEPKGVKNVLHELNGEGFQQLKHLLVQNSPQIQYIINSNFPRLESLFLHNLVNLEKICHDRLAIESFNKLRIVKVYKCDRLKHLFSFSMVKNLSQLQELEVTNCKKLEEIVFKESEEQVHQNDMISRVEFTQLRTLTLLRLPRLTSFGFNLFTPDTESQEIVSRDEPKGFMSLFSQNVVLPSLENLKLCSINIGCTWFDQLPVILVQLEKLEIRNCSMIKWIINTEELREEKEVFPKLLLLQLQGLPKLSRFSSGKSVEFPSLTQLDIQNCPKLKTFLSDSLSADLMPSKDDMHPLFDKKVAFPCLKILILNELPGLLHLWKEDSQPSSVFGNLTSLTVSDCDNIETLVPSSVSLQKLRTLTVCSCNSLMNLMTLSTAKTLVQLESMDICFCEMIEEMIIDMGADEILTAEGEKDAVINKITLFMLNSIVLEDLPSLTSFYSGTNTLECPSLKIIDIKACLKMETFVTMDLSIHSASFFSEKAISWCLQNLTELVMCDCDNLKYSFPSSMAESFVHLEFLELKLEGLPELTRFCDFNGNSIELPSLSELMIVNCPKMQTFASDSLCAKMETVVFPNTEDLSIHSASFFNEAISWCLQNLRALIMCDCGNLKYSFPSSMAESFVHLEVLELKLKGLPKLTRFCDFNGNSFELPSLSRMEIQNCPKMQTFAFDSLCADMPAIEEPEKVNTEETIHSFFDEKVAFPCLKVLELYKLPKLLHLRKGNSQPSKVFENLEHLKVAGCRNLKTLVPSSVSVQNLVTLEVKKCDGLKNLVTFSTAKSLEQLKKMKIILCKTIEEVIIDEGDVVKDGIVFKQLKYMKLGCLPSLTSFCKGNFTIEFPCLKRVLVMKCFKMMNFSQGVLSTPKLQRVQLKEEKDEWRWESKVCESSWEGEEDGGCWEGDFNTTIQKLFKDMNAESSEQK